MNKKSIKNLIALANNVRVYVPTTISVNEKFDVERTLSFLSKYFGGAISYKALGCWFSPTQGVLKEKVFICESFCNSDQLEDGMEKMVEYCEILKEELKQDSIAIEVNNVMHLI